MKKIATFVMMWVGTRLFALRHAGDIEQWIVDAEKETEQKQERIELLLQQIEARDKALTKATRRIDELEQERNTAMDKAIAAGTEADLQKAEVQRLTKQLQVLETKGEAEYAVLPDNGTGKKTRKSRSAKPEA